MKHLRTLILVKAALFSGTAWAAAPFSDTQTHCVAWKTKKTMFLIKKLEPVGMNCNISVAVESSGDTQKIISASFPVAGFDSGEKSRDKEVLILLNADKQPELLWRSEAMTDADWKSFLSKPSGSLSGTLKVGGEEFPVMFETTHRKTDQDFEVQGVHKTTYTAFKIAPPTVVGGAVAKVQDYLELHLRFSANKVKGAAAIAP